MWRRRSRPRDPDDFADEVRAHLEIEEARLRESGLPDAEAGAEARRRFGNPTRAIERVYEASRWRWLDALVQDVRFGLRLMRRSPAFTATAILVLALGIGVNTAFFSVVNAVFFRLISTDKPASIRFITAWTVDRPDVGMVIAAETVDLVAAQTQVFADVTGLSSGTSQVRRHGETSFLAGEYVTQNYFSLLGTRPALGRTIEAADERTDAAPVAVISDRLWAAWFDRHPDAIGGTFEIDLSRYSGYFGPWRTYRIVGVMPPRFRGVASVWQATDLWLPRRLYDDVPPRPNEVRRVRPWAVAMLARLQPGATDAGAQAVVTGIASSAQGSGPPRWTLALSRSRDERLPFDRARTLAPERLAAGLMLVAGLVFFMATTNLAGLLTARGIARRGEVAVRLALGAGRARLTRQFLTEGLMLAAGAVVPAVVLAQVLVAAFIAGTPARFDSYLASAPTSLDVPIDVRVLAFAALAAISVGLVVGLVPARRTTRLTVTSAMAAGSAGATPNRVSRLRHWIVVPQIGASLVLLLLASTLIQALVRAGIRDPGFDATSVFTMQVEMPAPLRPTSWADDTEEMAMAGRYERLLDRVTATPGVTSASLFGGVGSGSLPIPTGGVWTIARDAFASRAYRWLHNTTVTAGYFETLRVPLRAGRLFDERDRLGTPPVAVISESAARFHWPVRPAVGQYLTFHREESTTPPKWIEVIGVVGDVASPVADGWNPAVFLPAAQAPHNLGRGLMVRTSGRVGDVMRDVRAAVASVGVGAEVVDIGLLADRISAALYPRRMAAAILTAAGSVGLLLAAIGLYGVVSVSVAQRTKEMGIRTALGADRGDLVRLILRDGRRVLAFGLAGGAAMTYGAVSLASALVLPLPRFDAATILGVPALLALVVLAACWLPARRASRVDPVQVLRG